MVATEIWKPVKNWERLYECSNLGRLRSKPRQSWHNHSAKFITRKERYFKLNSVDSSGYIHVNLTSIDGTEMFLVHRLIAGTFISNPNNKEQVNHKNGIKTDNRVDNLEWCTRSENAKHAFKIGLQDNKGENHPTAKLNNKLIDEIRDSYIPNKRGNGCRALAKRYGLHKSHIQDIVRRKAWSHI